VLYSVFREEDIDGGYKVCGGEGERKKGIVFLERKDIDGGYKVCVGGVERGGGVGGREKGIEG
jgi:hypothetical protein